MSNYPYQQLSLFQQPNYQQPTYPQPNYQQTYQATTTPMTQTSIVWVTSEDYARQYPVAPNGTVYFMNENEPYFYAKSADAMGKPTFRKSRLVDESEHTENVNLTEYIKREEIDNIISNAVQKEVERRISEISFKPTRKQKVVDVEE